MPQIEISDYSMELINEAMNENKNLKTPDDVILYWVSEIEGFIYGSL